MAEPVTGRPQTRNLRDRLLRIATVMLGLYVLGFGAFLLALPAPGQLPPGVKGDGIVALTGELARLAPALALLDQGKGERLLITGVNPATSRADLRRLLGGGEKFDCCVDLDFKAADTRGNAAEAAAWARAHDYKTLIVVTAAYHMPRSLLEFSAHMPGVRLIPYAVAPQRTELPLQRDLARLLGEYAKYLASWTRQLLFKDAPPAPALQAPS
jgi:uncharacterized SAM-binding protein YcdF (DUF218 family)